MSSEEIEDHIRDHDEAIRNLEREAERSKIESERVAKELIGGMRSLHKRLSMAQEYQLRDNRLTAEDLKETLKEATALQAKTCSTHEGRIKELEGKAADLERYTTKAENNIYWLDRWALGITAVLFSFLGWDTFNKIK
jgi:predicted RNase H-like nuclease (RuvC/YqgF family)